jgi:hypothetical protein
LVLVLYLVTDSDQSDGAYTPCCLIPSLSGFLLNFLISVSHLVFSSYSHFPEAELNDLS